MTFIKTSLTKTERVLDTLLIENTCDIKVLPLKYSI